MSQTLLTASAKVLFEAVDFGSVVKGLSVSDCRQGQCMENFEGGSVVDGMVGDD